MRRMYSQAYILELINKGISTKQDTLVSRLNIKTINNNSILGSGNLVIAGGGGGGGAVDSVNGYTGDVVLTKSDIGLGSVDNTSDLNKPISTAQAAKNTQYETDIAANTTSITNEANTARTAEQTLTTNLSNEVTRATAAETANTTLIDNHKADKANPHSVTKAQVGLSNVDNTSDADKPISDAQALKNTELQTNIDNKQDSLVSGTNIKTIGGNTLLGSGDLAIITGSNVKKIDYSYTNTPISGIKVDNVDYRLVPIGADTDDSLAIGVGACAPNSGSIAIGQYAGLDAGSDALAEGSIAIGNSTCENMPWHVSFDMISDIPEITSSRSLDLYSPSNIFFRNENLTAANTYETQYTNGKTLQGYLDDKQDSLVSGTNIKTINGTSIIGSGDITVSGADAYTKAETDALLANKEDSANLAAVATSGLYSDLSNKPTIPTKTSELTNDSNYVSSVPIATFDLKNDYGCYISYDAKGSTNWMIKLNYNQGNLYNLAATLKNTYPLSNYRAYLCIKYTGGAGISDMEEIHEFTQYYKEYGYDRIGLCFSRLVNSQYAPDKIVAISGSTSTQTSSINSWEIPSSVTGTTYIYIKVYPR